MDHRKTNQNHVMREIHNSKELLLKELDVNIQQQSVLKSKISTIKDYAKNIGKDDPHYKTLFTQIRNDQITLEQLRIRQQALNGKLSSY